MKSQIKYTFCRHSYYLLKNLRIKLINKNKKAVPQRNSISRFPTYEANLLPLGYPSILDTFYYSVIKI